MIRQLLARNEGYDTESGRAFVLRACLMNLMFQKVPGLATILEGLRYRVEVRKSAQLGEIPLVTLSAPFATYRPSDELLMRATGYAGRPGFVEVINPDEAANLADPMRIHPQKIQLTSEQSSNSESE
jgi:hypothetical protein